MKLIIHWHGLQDTRNFCNYLCQCVVRFFPDFFLEWNWSRTAAMMNKNEFSRARQLCPDARKCIMLNLARQIFISLACFTLSIIPVAITLICGEKRQNMLDLPVFVCCQCLACYIFARWDTLSCGPRFDWTMGVVRDRYIASFLSMEHLSELMMKMFAMLRKCEIDYWLLLIRHLCCVWLVTVDYNLIMQHAMQVLFLL